MKVGLLLMFFGMLGMVLSTALSESLVVKVAMFIFCLFVVLFGVLIESPMFRYLKEGREGISEDYS